MLMPATDVQIVLPQILAEMTGGRRVFAASGQTPKDALLDLCKKHPHLQIHFFDEAGRARRHLICIVGEDYVRAPDLATHLLKANDEVRIINALAGGL